MSSLRYEVTITTEGGTLDDDTWRWLVETDHIERARTTEPIDLFAGIVDSSEGPAGGICFTVDADTVRSAALKGYFRFNNLLTATSIPEQVYPWVVSVVEVPVAP